MRAAYLAGDVVLTPNPRVHAILANKRNLALLTDPDLLRAWGVPAETIEALGSGIPRTVVVIRENADALWSERARKFFKPASGYGSKAAYRGDKITRRVWSEILAGDYVAQEIVPPSTRAIAIDGRREALKVDFRNFTYDGRVQLLAARLYQGQTTNFRTIGGGFAPVFVGHDATCPTPLLTRSNRAAMIIKSHADVTPAVLAEIERADDPRFREIMSALVRHLHDFVRETRLTEPEFQQACAIINAIGQKSSPSHNEAVLMAGSLGVSSLVCLLNNGDKGATETTANLLGPFWRADQPRIANGGSIVRSPTPGAPIFVTATVRDRAGRPVAGAEVDVWHSTEEGYYENHDPTQADMNLRGKFTTDAKGQISFRSVKPAGYPIPSTARSAISCAPRSVTTCGPPTCTS